LKQIASLDELAGWAHRILPTKNTLQKKDACRLEDEFAARAQAMTHAVDKTANSDSNDDSASSSTDEAPSPDAPQPASAATAASNGAQTERRRARRSPPNAPGIDKSVLAFPEPRRIRDKEHLKFVAMQPCLVCGRSPSDAHHIRFAQLRALGRKVSDEFTVPLCRTHHREVHRRGNEQAWWETVSVDPLAEARRLWLSTHPLPITESSARNEAI
jgi:hypothetical protein